eukprot:6183551-Pleurochrysis_carterae.AAC.2
MDIADACVGGRARAQALPALNQLAQLVLYTILCLVMLLVLLGLVLSWQARGAAVVVLATSAMWTKSALEAFLVPG